MTKLLLLFFIIFTSPSFSQSVKWIQTEDLGFRIVKNQVSRTISTGVIIGGSFTGDSHLPEEKGIFLITYSVDGETIWKKQYAGGHSKVLSICEDGEKNLYVSIFNTNLTIDGINYHNNDQSKITLLLKFSSSGELNWVKSFPFILNLSATMSNSISVTGRFGSRIEYENIILSPGPDGGGIFMGEINFDGQFLHATSDPGGMIFDLRYHKNYFWGSSGIIGTETIGLGEDEITLTEAVAESFIAKYDARGKINRVILSPYVVYSFDVDDQGNVYSIERDTTETDLKYFIKYSNNGEVQVKREILRHSPLYGNWDIHIRNQKEIILTGGYQYSMTFGGTQFIDSINTRGVIASLDNAGNVNWVVQTEGKGAAWIKTIDISDPDEIYVSGDLEGSISFAGDAIHAKRGAFTAKLSLPKLTTETALSEIRYFEVSVFPNPSSSTFNIKIFSTDLDVFDFRLSDTAGQVVLTEVTPEFTGKYQKEIQYNLSCGVYYLDATSRSGKRYREKVVVSK